MQLKKIDTDHYVVVTDDPILLLDIVLETYVDGTQGLEQIDTLNDIHPLLHKKVIASTKPIGGEYAYIKSLDLSYIKSLVGDYIKIPDFTFEEDNDYKSTRAFLIGYNQCLEDHTKVIHEILDHLCGKMELITQEMIDKGDFQLARYRTFKYVFDYIKSLTQPKDTWEVEFIDGQFKLK